MIDLDTIISTNNPLSKKVSDALNRISNVLDTYESAVILGTSGGKDSTVIYDLTKRIYPDIIVVHTPKDNTHDLTKLFLYDLSKETTIINVPAYEMERFIQETGIKCQIDGTRIDEATRTDGRSTSFVQNGIDIDRTRMKPFVEQGLFGLSFLYPIFDWTDQEVWEYIKIRNLKISAEYGTIQ